MLDIQSSRPMRIPCKYDCYALHVLIISKSPFNPNKVYIYVAVTLGGNKINSETEFIRDILTHFGCFA